MTETIGTFFATGGAPLIIAAIVSLLLGALEAFLGYKIFKVQVAIIAFLSGFFIGDSALNAALGIFWVSIVAGVLLGAVLAVFSLKFFKAGVFVLVGFFGALVGYSFVQNIWFALLAGVLLGILGVFLTKPVIILSTAFGGASIIAAAVGSLFWGTPLAMPLWLNWGILVVAGVCGAIVQFRANRGKA